MRIWIAIVLAGLMLHACAHQSTYHTSCGPFTGTFAEYREYLQACQVLQVVEWQNTSAQENRKAALAVAAWAHAENAAREEQQFAPERIAKEILDALDRDGGNATTAMRVAVMLASCGTLERHCANIHNRITTTLVQHNRVTCLERADLNALREELARQRTSAFDPQTVVQAGKFVGATHVLLLDITPSANPWEAELIHVHARLVTVRRAIVIAASQRVFRP